MNMRTGGEHGIKVSRRGGLPGWCLLLLCLQLFSYQQVRADPRSLYIWGPLSTEYVAETAQFGDPVPDPLPANLMLPPDNPWLCEYPPSLENITSTDLALLPQFQFDKDVALFVSINRCSAETKARVLAQMNERISNRIKLLILYSTNPQEFQFVSLRADDNESDLEDLRDIGVLYIPHRYASGIDLRMRMQYQGDDPRFSYEGSENWSFPIEVTPLSDNARGTNRDSTDYRGGDIYWFRIILFSLLIASPCCRACYLWYAGGGRMHWRRDEQGRIVGIQYIPYVFFNEGPFLGVFIAVFLTLTSSGLILPPFLSLIHSPMPLWLTTGRPPHDAPTPVGVLTEAEFNNLPEIVYEGIPEKVESDTDEDGDEEDDNANKWSTAEVKSGTEDNDVNGSNAATSETDVEAGEPTSGTSTPGTPTPPVTRADEGEVALENFPLNGSTPETHADESESPADNVPPEAMDDGGFLKENKESAGEGPAAASNDAEFLEKGDISQANTEDLKKVPSEPDEEKRPVAVHDSETEKSVVTEANQTAAEPVPLEQSDATEANQPAAEPVPLEQPVDSTAGTEAKEGSARVPVDPSANETENGATLPESNPEGCGCTSETAEPCERENPAQDDRQTTSTACAICIDEFETGERLTLLPRCKHAFHRECIHAWLIERQGCCPLCKTDVIEHDPNNSPGELDIEAPPEQRFMMSSM